MVTVTVSFILAQIRPVQNVLFEKNSTFDMHEDALNPLRTKQDLKGPLGPVIRNDSQPSTIDATSKQRANLL